LIIRIPLKISDFKNAIFNIREKVISQFRYIINILSMNISDDNQLKKSENPFNKNRDNSEENQKP
jgi:hypothetical protein